MHNRKANKRMKNQSKVQKKRRRPLGSSMRPAIRKASYSLGKREREIEREKPADPLFLRARTIPPRANQGPDMHVHVVGSPTSRLTRALTVPAATAPSPLAINKINQRSFLKSVPSRTRPLALDDDSARARSLIAHNPNPKCNNNALTLTLIIQIGAALRSALLAVSSTWYGTSMG